MASNQSTSFPPTAPQDTGKAGITDSEQRGFIIDCIGRETRVWHDGASDAVNEESRLAVQ